MEKEVVAIKRDCLRMSWLMRGGATYEDVLYMSDRERGLIGDMAKENNEIAQKSGQPYF